MTREIDTGSDDLLARVEGNVGIITFNRPERRNALSNGIYGGFASVLPAMATDPEVRVVMITGNGGAFCAGGDVKGMNDANQSGGQREGRAGSHDDRVTQLREMQNGVSLALHRMPKPVVAAIPGAAAGAGLSIALAADIRLAAERAIFVTAFTGIGASGDFGGSWFLTHLVGTAKAKELYWTSPRLTSTEALDLGMVNHVLPDDRFDEAALEWCHDLASRAPIAQRLSKENLNRALTCDLATALDAEASNMVRSMTTKDHIEAALAFVEKRPAAFTGE
jgi:2-(1,2-epoxy-1,2-dihydrophenyl)acetyl-CoA isomerase